MFKSLKFLFTAVLFQSCSYSPSDSSNHSRQPLAAVQSLYRLPDYTVPVKYLVKLAPNLGGNFNFSGEVFINILVRKTTNMVRLHCKNLQINGIEIYNVPDDGNKQNANSYLKLLGNDESLVIMTKGDLKEKTEYKLHIVFSGTMSTRMVGLYRSSYQFENQTKLVQLILEIKVGFHIEHRKLVHIISRWLAATKFTPTYARMAFPCYDEPQFKTPFVISLARYLHQKAISNTPVESTSQPEYVYSIGIIYVVDLRRKVWLETTPRHCI